MRTLSLALVCLAAACSRSSADPKSSGPQVTEARPVGAFHGLRLTAVLDVTVTVGPATKLEVTGPKDWVPRLETKVEDGVLVARMTGRWSDVPELKLVITTPELTSIDASGVVDVHATKIAAKSFSVDLSGVGTVELAGTTGALHVDASGAGSVAAKDLAAASATVEMSGAGDVTLQAKQALDASLSGVGDLTVYGKPASVKKQMSGVGEIRMR